MAPYIIEALFHLERLGLLIFTFAQAGEIHDAAEAGDLAKVQSILDSDPSQVNAKTEYSKETPLILAAEKCHMEVVQLLIEKGADVNATEDILGDTPLHSAAKCGSKDIAELLLSKGTDVNAKNSSGSTALSMAKFWNVDDLVEVLTKHGGTE
ncbi:MAG: ankyrin repeat domain-containing protein [Armatimonadetes bacterium]|nr:ankyrin repeat domain-containing protein [Armatimonadota bacterium]